MANSVEVRIHGLPEFKSRLRFLGYDMERKVMRSAGMAAASVFKRAAAANAPVGKVNSKTRTPGRLKKNVFAGRSKNRSKPGMELIVVGVRNGKRFQKGKENRDAYYWRWVEAGHVATGPGKRLKGGERSRALQRDRLRTAGRTVPGVWFMRRAFDANQDKAVKAFNKRIEARIAKAQKDLNTK
ncbi:MAG TPA: HK97-gp10 family putative phage morphogenesis protein [Rhodocyclaceae bacterium]